MPSARGWRSRRVRRFAVLWACLFGIAAVWAGTYVLAFRTELDQAAARGSAELELASDRLTGDLQRYRELAVILADHPMVLTLALISKRDRDSQDAASFLLQTMSDKTGAQSLTVVSREGSILATSEENGMPDGVQPAFKRAMDGALGVAHYVDDQGRRRFVYAAPVFKPNGPPAGAVLVYIDVGALEWSWPSAQSAVYFTDEDAVAFVSNRSEFILKGGDNAPLPVAGKRVLAGYDLWRFDAGPYIPVSVLHLSKPLPTVELTAELLVDLAPVRVLAALQAATTAAIAFAFSAFLILAMERRRTLAEANARLESRVAKRTAALEVANTDLRREIADRQEAEARLKRAQADLVQAGKLSALGEMSAGISHELNQPLMAIRSFAENAQAFLERGSPERAADNLGRISELSRRMGRIIKNLRAFARQEKETISDVDICAVVDAALEMTHGKISGAGVSVDWTPTPGLYVRGGEVRLQQVVMNLVSNAVDAMAAQDNGLEHGPADKAASEAPQPPKTIEIRVEAMDGDMNGDIGGALVRLTVRDTGPGIAEPDLIFDPFYTTKEVGASEGMGLGLSISYGLVKGFGGRIKGANSAMGGAEFTIDLHRAAPRDMDHDVKGGIGGRGERSGPDPLKDPAPRNTSRTPPEEAAE